MHRLGSAPCYLQTYRVAHPEPVPALRENTDPAPVPTTRQRVLLLWFSTDETSLAVMSTIGIIR